MGLGGVILVSDKQSRLKPCLRCGYSLRYAGAKNCPECGLAVRISLSGNSGLEWSNPGWQRFLALGFGVLAIGQLCRLLRFAADWIIYAVDEEYYQLGDATFRFLLWLYRYAGEADPIICGLALCLLAKGERRYPDNARPARAIRLGAGVLLIALGLLEVLARDMFSWSRRSWVVYVLSHILYGPWVPLVISILACAYAFHLGKRSGSRLLMQLSQVPLWPAAAAVVVWIFNFDRLFWPLPSVLLEAAFPLCMLVMLTVTIRTLLSGARESDQNWVTDP